MRDRLPPAERLAALAVAALGLASLRAQFDSMTGTTPDRLWAMAGYFTVLTNALVTGHMVLIALHWRIRARRAAGLLLSIAMVAGVYHLILAPAWNPPNALAAWADLGLHSGVPLAYALWWAVMAPKDISLRDLPLWLIWPMGYAVYALIRGAMTGFWPYPFLNADGLGWVATLRNVALMAGGFALAGGVILWLGRLRR